MEEITLLQKFVDSELIRGLSAGNKALASFYITLMGMMITFIALSLLWGSVSLLSIFFRPRKKGRIKEEEPSRPSPGAAEPARAKTEGEDGERIAVITPAVAVLLDRPVSTIRVKAIYRSDDPTPQWGKVGRIEQLMGR